MGNITKFIREAAWRKSCVQHIWTNQIWIEFSLTRFSKFEYLTVLRDWEFRQNAFEIVCPDYPQLMFTRFLYLLIWLPLINRDPQALLPIRKSHHINCVINLPGRWFVRRGRIKIPSLWKIRSIRVAITRKGSRSNNIPQSIIPNVGMV